jgi:hypothetical protein
MAKCKNPPAVSLGRLDGLAGGAKGAKSRAETLTAQERIDIARQASLAQWAKDKRRSFR